MKKNFIFEKTHELEAEVEALGENIFLGVESCQNNKEEILHHLIHARHCLRQVYILNQKNMENYVDKTDKVS